jgi:hypothetical protein
MMAVLNFVCPRTGQQVDTGFDLDPASFADLPREITRLSCPHCDEPHLLAHISAWLGELLPGASIAELANDEARAA